MMTSLNKNLVRSGEPDVPESVREIGGFADKKLLEPTRYGDWEVGGRCSDF
ncbi:MAG: DUF1674 domain-containing protein [Alphaproteobacteria bacterium]|nr:DUF1674 domain-containing protein [Alphaproteobacteria bacterium]MBP7758669.1 DUF1674 domain-containing protein [Alphaproteobacteria bacterium]MBP7761697.1 DUF1674 domain-containing protein [Alphaproteobacteria bacterium]MBP7903968.1 DUF1674 domain-containing protein [Alphaproteobacteria bacterium]